jgi:hypothetical protein
MNTFVGQARFGATSLLIARDDAARSWVALMLALAAGALSLMAPVLAFAAIAYLGVRSLARAQTLRLDATALLAPALAALVVGSYAGLAGAVGVVFIWRVYVDCRWSLAAAKSQATGVRPDGWRLQAHAWLTPLFGVSVVAYTAPHMIAGLPLDLPHVPIGVPVLAGALAAGAIFDWGLRQAVDWRLGELQAAQAAQMASHHLLFVFAFGLSIDVSAGVVALIAWRLAHAALKPAQAVSLTAVP